MLESYVGEENAEEKRKAELRDIAVSKSEEQCRSDYSKALIRLWEHFQQVLLLDI